MTKNDTELDPVLDSILIPAFWLLPTPTPAALEFRSMVASSTRKLTVSMNVVVPETVKFPGINTVEVAPPRVMLLAPADANNEEAPAPATSMFAAAGIWIFPVV